MKLFYIGKQAFKQFSTVKIGSNGKSNNTLTNGLPLLLLIVGGSYFLSVFMSTHMEMKDKQNKSTSVRKFDLEKEHKELLSKLDIENFSLSRIPRPVDESDDVKHNNKKQ